MDNAITGQARKPQHFPFDRIWNFVINSGECSFDDIRSLEKEIVDTVRDEKGITLEREVIYISPEGKKF